MPGDLPNLHMVSLQVTRDSRTYSVGVCTAAAGPEQGGCKDGGVCLLSGDSKGASFGRLASMQLDYRHQDEAVILSYVNGDTCPPGDVLLGAGSRVLGSGVCPACVLWIGGFMVATHIFCRD